MLSSMRYNDTLNKFIAKILQIEKIIVMCLSHVHKSTVTVQLQSRTVDR